VFLRRRRDQRVKRRFSCEFLAEGQRYRGIIVELSPSGFFVQTDATTPPGAEVDLHLIGAGAVPDLGLRAIVVRRRMLPAPLATAVRRGIALEILEREVVTLDEAGARAVHALVGRDLSPLGMRVDPHPELALHQRLRLALYEPSVGRPLLLEAEVARDDGEAGLALRFVDVASEVAGEIASIVASLPALESLRPEGRRIVVGEYLLESHAA